MLYNYPFYRFPYYGKANFNNNSYQLYSQHKINNTTYNDNKTNFKSNNKQPNNCDNLTQKSDCLKQNDYNDNETFDFFGLKLHFDDILIIFLLVFLYKEKTDDIYLYITLLLLLFN